MLINKERLIFVHIPKNAGTLLTMMLTDLFLLKRKTPLLKTDLRSTEIYDRGQPELAKFWETYQRGDDTTVKPTRAHYADHLIKSRAHKNIDYYAEQLGKHQFDRYFSFCFVRNPYVRVISMYLFLCNIKNKYTKWIRGLSFSDFILEGYFKDPKFNMSHFVAPQRDYVILANGQMAVNFIGKVENLAFDLEEVLVCLHYSPEEATRIAHEYTNNQINYTKSKIDINYVREQYSDPAMIERVYQTYQCDFELFKYSKDIDQACQACQQS